MDLPGLAQARAALAADIIEAESRRGPTLNAEGPYAKRTQALKQMRASLRLLDAAAAEVAGLPALVALPVEKPVEKKKGAKR